MELTKEHVTHCGCGSTIAITQDQWEAVRRLSAWAEAHQACLQEARSTEPGEAEGTGGDEG